MKLYQIPCPLKPNGGGTYEFGTWATFLDTVAREAGGYTIIHNTDGAWKDDDGNVQWDKNDIVQFAMHDDGTKLMMIRAAFAHAFPDQKTIMVANIGTAEIMSNVSPIHYDCAPDEG